MRYIVKVRACLGALDGEDMTETLWNVAIEAESPEGAVRDALDCLSFEGEAVPFDETRHGEWLGDDEGQGED